VSDTTDGSACGQRPPEPQAAVVRDYLKALHASACLAAFGQDQDKLCFVLCAFESDGQTGPRTRRFQIGQIEPMVQKALEWSREPGWNVYIAPVLYWSSKLLRRGRGGTEAIAYVLGLGADLDHDNGQDTRLVTGFRPGPSFAIRSSSHPAPNYNPVWLFRRARNLAEAQSIANALCAHVDDKSGATKDLTRVWRVPGSLNWIAKKKAARRGLPWPSARVVPPGVV
jgi:hypothetical protein